MKQGVYSSYAGGFHMILSTKVVQRKRNYCVLQEFAIGHTTSNRICETFQLGWIWGGGL